MSGVYIFRIRHKGMLAKMQRTGVGVCYTCAKPFRIGDYVVKSSKEVGKNRSRRHIECAKRVGIEISLEDIPWP